MLVTYSCPSFLPLPASPFLFQCQRFKFDTSYILGQASECLCLIHFLLIKTDKHYIFLIVSLVGHTEWLVPGICE